MIKINRFYIIQLVRKLEEKFRLEKDFINKLDAEIGDGDHGTNMEQSFAEMRKVLTEEDKEDFSTILKDIGDSFLRSGGGIGTFLYGSSLNKASQKLNEKTTLAMEDFKQILQDMREEIRSLGEVEPGQKTMYDVLNSAIEYNLTVEDNSVTSPLEELENISIVADRAMLETKNMVAKKGRASYFGEKSLGHIDPGAYSMYLIFLTIYDYYKEQMILNLLKEHKFNGL